MVSIRTVPLVHCGLCIVITAVSLHGFSSFDRAVRKFRVLAVLRVREYDQRVPRIFLNIFPQQSC